MKARTTVTKLPNLITTAILGTFALMGGAPSMAADGSEAHQVVVKYGDLNLSNPQGAAVLYRRISTAAHDVCEASEVDSVDLGTRAVVDACLQRAISGAVTKVGRSELFAIYNAKNSAPIGPPVAAAQTR